MVTLRTEAENIDESQTTLRFAQRAKAVKTKVKDNTVTVLDSAKLLKEVEALPSPNPNPNPNRNPNPNPNRNPNQVGASADDSDLRRRVTATLKQAGFEASSVDSAPPTAP